MKIKLTMVCGYVESDYEEEIEVDDRRTWRISKRIFLGKIPW